jgi:hypothetical protein
MCLDLQNQLCSQNLMCNSHLIDLLKTNAQETKYLDF